MVPTLTLLVPLYNSADNIPNIISVAQKIKTPFELLLINDGSTDNTASICREAEQQYNFIRFINKPHTGVSDTRNTGLSFSKGKYILFIDADDSLSDESADRLCQFFDECGEVVDLVTYPIETHYKGRVLPYHFRYQTLHYSGIFDLNYLPYIGQTTMNIMVRNRFKDNILFDTSMTFSEDQRYCCEVLKDKMKMGFCLEAKYIYNRSETSSSGKISGACYIFEQSMKMFEDMFGTGSSEIPAAFQGLYINDLAWKLRSNILYPYHYKGEQFQAALVRIKKLLAKVDNKVILDHPDINYFHKYYWLSQKPDNGIVPFFTSERFGLKDHGKVIQSQDHIEIVVTRIRTDNDKLIFRGFLKSVVFNFAPQPNLYAFINGKRILLDLYDSAHSYYFCRTKTNNFYSFCLETEIDVFESLKFIMEINGQEYYCSYYFMPKTPFSHNLRRYDVPMGSISLHFDPKTATFIKTPQSPKRTLIFNNKRLPVYIRKLRRKAAALRYKKNICIYYDCRGVGKDNGWYRFRDDCKKDDGIVRKYIYDGKQSVDKLLADGIKTKDLIPFGSQKHKLYCLAARKIVTAYIEDINILPFKAEKIPLYSDFFDFEVEYIQHGILHASLPWKYTPEMIIADKVAVSTDYEMKLFTEKYHFRSEDIIPSIMPRLKNLDKTVQPKRKILFAPSWRQYLIGPDIDGKWQPLEELFVSSDYFKGITEFLTSGKLKTLLEQYGYTLDFKLHPIFETYHHCFDIESERVRMVNSADPIGQYSVFITDFSSFVFDFIYLGKKVFSFIPDKMQFECGMNSYREIEPLSRSFLKTITLSNVEELFENSNSNKGIIFYG